MNKTFFRYGFFTVTLLFVFGAVNIALACPTSFSTQYDINQDGSISQVDSNAVSSYINAHSAYDARYDVDVDGYITGSDVITIINYINAGCMTTAPSSRARVVVCNTSSDCGSSSYIGNTFCSNGNVSQNYKTYICNNPGSTNSYCTDRTEGLTRQQCGSGQSCQNGSCSNNNNSCNQNSQRQCYNGDVYWYDSCGNRGSIIDNCSSAEVCQNGYCQNNNNDNNNSCTSNYSQKCHGDSLYWYDSCDNRQSLIRSCSDGCYGSNDCRDGNTYNQYPYNNQYPYYQYPYNQYDNQYSPYQYSGCTPNAYKQCVGNNIYWFDSCQHQGQFYQTCSYGLTCQYGQCVSQPYVPSQPTYPTPSYPSQPSYYSKSYTQCYANDIYWYDSLGKRAGLYKSCDDNNSCTQDSCSSKKCSNELKCDGSTCGNTSSDYAQYCKQAGLSGQGIDQNALSVSFLAKEDPNAIQWSKEVSVGPNSSAYFLISVTNNSDQQMNSVFVSANIPAKITSLGNLKIDEIPLSKDIVAGIDVGPIMPRTTKNITFEGKTQSFGDLSKEQGVAIVNFDSQNKSDAVSLNINPNYAKASVASSGGSSKFTNFIKKWYLWIIGLLVFAFLFIIVFRRVSQTDQ